ncbi:MAG: glycosyltransferase family 4 protein [Gallintestinimicrobium sp.]|uniref:glycosyltransferase family 4 protein n=1 Tax=Gallintestinimicrobium sp. TaxID=2981655 RepID=UPI003994FC42
MSENKSIRVITVGNAPSVKGGISSVISQIMSHDWKEQNVQMKLISTFEGGNALKKIIVFIKGYILLKKECKNTTVDVVHIHMSQNGSFTRKYYIHKLCKKYGIPDIIHLHSSGFVGFYEKSNESKKKKIRELLTDCGCVVALGKEWEQRIKRIAPAARVLVMNNTIHIPHMLANQDVECVEFLYLGVLVKRKGVIDLLEAINKLKHEGLLQPGKVTFNIGGTGECEGVLRDYVSKNELRPFVNFLGWVIGEEKTKLLQSNQVLVLPSYDEGLPIAILEAISYGMPVIATNVGSVAEAVHDGENGIIYEAGDINALVNALEKMIISNDLRRNMAIASRCLAEKCFDDTKYFNLLRNMYDQLVKKEVLP